jgi:hypothetical protein
VEDFGEENVKDMETFRQSLQKFSKINEDDLKDKLINVKCQELESVEKFTKEFKNNLDKFVSFKENKEKGSMEVYKIRA